MNWVSALVVGGRQIIIAEKKGMLSAGAVEILSYLIDKWPQMPDRMP
jgi:hypothetical protein